MQGMSDLGYSGGKNLTVEWRTAAALGLAIPQTLPVSADRLQE